MRYKSKKNYWRRSVTSIIILASTTLFCFSGCTSPVKTVRTDIYSNGQRPYHQAVINSSLIGYVSDSGVAIDFEGGNASIYPKARELKGVDSLGDAKTISLEKIKLLKFKGLEIAPRYMKVSEYFKTLENIDNIANSSTDVLLIPMLDRIYSDDKKFVLDSASGLLRGRTVKGIDVEVPIEDLHYVVHNRRNTAKSIRSALAVGYLALVFNALFDVIDFTDSPQ